MHYYPGKQVDRDPPSEVKTPRVAAALASELETDCIEKVSLWHRPRYAEQALCRLTACNKQRLTSSWGAQMYLKQSHMEQGW